jgi:beta-lactamase regulating signal transducer with metallopeptidase domain
MTAADIIAILLAVNLAASIAILAVLGLRGTIRRMAGAQAAYLSWLIVPAAVAACLIPARVVTIEMPGASQAAISSPAPASIETDVQAGPAAPAMPREVSAPAPAETSLPSQVGQVIDRAPGLELTLELALDVAAIVWAAGAIGALIFLFLRQALAVRALGPLALVSANVWRAAQSAVGPAVVGILAPRIVLPANFEAAFDDTERKVVLAHEEAHLKGRHTAVKALTEIAVCLNWFNPLAHLAARAIAMDQELACDETVVQRYPAHRKAYAAVLLKTQAGPRVPMGCYWPAASAPALKTRIVQIQRNVPGAKRRVIGASVLVLAAIAAAGCAWVSRPPETRYAEAGQPAAPVATEVQAPASTKAEPQSEYWPTNLRAPMQGGPPPAPTGEPLRNPPRGSAFAGGKVYAAWPSGMDGMAVSSSITEIGKIWSPGRFTLTGRVEKIEFGETRYTVFVRAAYLSAPRNWQVAYLAHGIQPNAELWELNPTNYFGDPDSRKIIEKDLLNHDIQVTGYAPIPNPCQPACKMTKTLLFVLAPTAQPTISQAKSFGITAMLSQYDLSKTAAIRGVVKRIEFSDRGVFDIYVEDARRGGPGPVYQVRSEYSFPRAEIEDRLMNQEILVAGWPSKMAAADSICETECGLYATDIAFESGARLTPMGDRLVSPGSTGQEYWTWDGSNGQPKLQSTYFSNAYNSSGQVMEGWDVAAPVTIEGKIVRRDDEGVWIEAQKFEPASMVGAKPGTLWRVVYPDLSPPLPSNGRTTQWISERIALEGQTITVRGLMSVDKSCKPACTMRGAIWKGS